MFERREFPAASPTLCASGAVVVAAYPHGHCAQVREEGLLEGGVVAARVVPNAGRRSKVYSMAANYSKSARIIPSRARSAQPPDYGAGGAPAVEHRSGPGGHVGADSRA